MFRVDTISGLHGTLIAYSAFTEGATATGIALVRRDREPHRAYSTHILQQTSLGIVAMHGHYDMTEADAREDFAERSGFKEV